MRVHGWVALAVCLGAALLAVGVVGANQPPVADAGLDQTVEQNATVYLDAGGSYDPDSGDTVQSYRWSLAAPNGTTVEPACTACERTHFRATETGRYEATVTVTDGEGKKRNDTVYIDVQTGDPPSVSLTGPASLFAGSVGTASADVRAGDDPLSRLVWSVDGATVATERLAGEGTYERDLSFTESGDHTVTVAVTDASGRRTSASHAVDVVANSSSPAGQSTGGGGFGGARPDASTDFVAANSDQISTYSDLSFNNYADGDSAITIANTAGPGDITLVDGETAQNYLEPYNWQTVNLGELVEDGLVNVGEANKILQRAKQNQNELGNGAVGGINPYEQDNTWQPSQPPNDIELTPPPSNSDSVSSTGDTGDVGSGQGVDSSEPGGGSPDLAEMLAPASSGGSAGLDPGPNRDWNARNDGSSSTDSGSPSDSNGDSSSTTTETNYGTGSGALKLA